MNKYSKGDINQRRSFHRKRWCYLLDDNNKTAWIVKGHIGRCNMCGKIIVEQTKEDNPTDATGSDYEWMAERIEELEGNEILNVGFSRHAANKILLV